MDGRAFCVTQEPGWTTSMLCLECAAEMRLVQVVEDTTMLVSGYEHHTWQCSACSTVERRMTFTREKTPTPIAPTDTSEPRGVGGPRGDRNGNFKACAAPLES